MRTEDDLRSALKTLVESTTAPDGLRAAVLSGTDPATASRGTAEPSDPAPSGGSRTRLLAALAAAAVVVGIAVVGVVLPARRDHPGTRATTTGAAAPYIVRNGTRLDYHGSESVQRPFVDATDPAVVHVYGDAQWFPGKGCTGVTVARVVSQTATTVSLVVDVYLLADTPAAYPSGSNGTVECFEYGNVQRLDAHTVRLDTALASRRLLDAHTGRTLSVKQASSIPTPTFLPAGYGNPVTDRGDNLSLGDLMHTSYLYRDTASSIIVIAGSYTLDHVVGHRTVHGRPATIYAEFPDLSNGAISISWTEADGRALSVCVGLYGVNMNVDSSDHHYVSPDVLTAVAQSLR